MTAKNRRELKQKFRTGAQPTAQDYADVLDSGFNGLDDGINKPLEPYLPVRIKGNGAGLNILDFYNDDTHHWRISLLANNDSGYNIADPSGRSHFFMEDGTGNIGLGMSKPKGKLHINQADDAGDAVYIEDFKNDATPTRITNAGNIYVRSEVTEGEVDDANFYVNGDTRVVSEGADASFFHINRHGGISFNALTDALQPQIDMHCPMNLHGALVVEEDVEIKGKLTVFQEMDIKSVAQGDGGTIQLGDTNGDQVSIRGKLNSGDAEPLKINDSVSIDDHLSTGGNLAVQGTATIAKTLDVTQAFSALSATISQAITAATVSGNGAGLTHLNANNIATGTVPFARLPTDTNKNLGTSNTLLPTQSAVKQYVDAEIAKAESAFDEKLDDLERNLRTYIDGVAQAIRNAIPDDVSSQVASLKTKVDGLKIPTGLEWGGSDETGYLNDWDDDLSYTYGSGRVMVGAFSTHSNSKEDRKWKFRSRTLKLKY